MNEKIINVFYGSDCLPYKDKERIIHFPITGTAFLGASDTTKIRFYYKKIGSVNATWVSVAKLPNGKQGSKVLDKFTDSEINEPYAELSLNSWYTQAKGDVYIALQGYQGGVEYSYDSETELYEIHGTPTIQTTGSIKLSINYAPIGQVADYTDEFSTYQEILAELGEKANIDSVPLLVELTDFASYQELYDYVGDRPFIATAGALGTSICRFERHNPPHYDRYTLEVFSAFGSFETEYLTMSDVIDPDFTKFIVGANNVVYLYQAQGTLTDIDLSRITKDNAFIVYSGEFYYKHHYSNDYNISHFLHTETQLNQSTGEINVVEYFIDVNIATGAYSTATEQHITYSKDKIDSLFTLKQDKLYSGDNIKTINNISLLGSGNIDIQGGGGGSTEWGQITGDIKDQTDLQTEIHEAASGKTQTFTLSYQATAPENDTQAQRLMKLNGEHFTDLQDFLDYVKFGNEAGELANQDFNSQNSLISLATETSRYIILVDKKVLAMSQYDRDNRVPKTGDIFLVIETTDSNGDTLPDRWYSYESDGCYKLETGKVDLTSYYTKSQTDTEDNKVAHDIALEYDSTTIYGVGDLCIKDKVLYKCTTANTTGTWDSTKWSQVTINGELGIIKSDIAHIGNKWIGAYVGDETAFTTDMAVGDVVIESTGGQFLINEITFSGTILTKVVLVGLEDNGNPVVHTFENNTWSSSNYVITYINNRAPVQWYGTQAQYDALSSYDSNTIYNILES